jgi:hypothetical protein
MAEGENTTPAAETTVTENVTDADLSAAWENDQVAKEETSEETVMGEEGQEEHSESLEQEEDGESFEEPADNRERSRLGRRMKTIEANLQTILEKMEATTKPNDQQQQAPYIPTQQVGRDAFIDQQLNNAISQGLLPEIITTAADVRKIKAYEDVLGAQYDEALAVQYTKGYLGETQRLKTNGKVSDDLHAEIMQELRSETSPYNARHTGNPAIDARINYAEAKAALLTKKVAAPKTVFKGKADLATGITTSTRMDNTKDEMPELDAKALEFVKYTGMKPETVKATLKGDMPFHLRGTGGAR